MHKKQFYSKIILFGEYTIVVGGDALAIPLRNYAAYWQQSPQPNPYIQSLQNFCDYCATHLPHIINTPQFAHDIHNGIALKSNIPLGYGAGSSGALCAAVLYQYGYHQAIPTDINTLKSLLATMEGYFHGSSSGIDPLVSYIQQPILIQQNIAQTCTTPQNLSTYTFFLIDTHKTRATAPLVQHFKTQLKQPEFAQAIQTMKHLNQLCIQQYLALEPHNENQLYTYCAQLSALQFQHMQAMIPPSFAHFWHTGITTGKYYLKLCGAGGGGFLLGIAPRTAIHQHTLYNQPIIPIQA